MARQLRCTREANNKQDVVCLCRFCPCEKESVVAQRLPEFGVWVCPLGTFRSRGAFFFHCLQDGFAAKSHVEGRRLRLRCNVFLVFDERFARDRFLAFEEFSFSLRAQNARETSPVEFQVVVLALLVRKRELQSAFYLLLLFFVGRVDALGPIARDFSYDICIGNTRANGHCTSVVRIAHQVVKTFSSVLLPRQIPGGGFVGVVLCHVQCNVCACFWTVGVVCTLTLIVYTCVQQKLKRPCTVFLMQTENNSNMQT